MEITNIINIGDSILPKISASIDGIQFNNIPPAEKTGTKGTTFWSSSANINVWKNGGNGKKWKSAVNVVDIDWNGALMRFNDTSRIFNSTGDLLKYIQDLHDEVINNELTVSSALNLLNSRIIQSGNSGGGSTVIPSYDYGQPIASVNDKYITIPDLTITKEELHEGDVLTGVVTTWSLDVDRLDLNNNLSIGDTNIISKNGNILTIGNLNDIKTIELSAYDKVYRRGYQGNIYYFLDQNSISLQVYYTERTSLSNSSGETTFSDNDTLINPNSTTGDFLKIVTTLGTGDANDKKINTYLPLAGYVDSEGSLVEKHIGLISGEDKYKLDNALTTKNLKLNYANNQLSLTSGSTKLGNSIDLSNINGNVKILQVEQRSNTNNIGINYNNNSTNLTDLIYKQCADGISIIKVTPTLDKDYSSLNCVVNFIGQESDYKYFEISGPLVYSLLNKFAFPSSSMDAVYGKWVVKIGKDSDITILKNLGNDNRTKANIEISDLSSTEVYPGGSTLIVIKSNISGNISINTQGTLYYSLEVIKLSNTSSLVKITNTNAFLALQVINKDFISVSFTPTDTDLYLPSRFTINNQAINIYGKSLLTENAVIYPLHIDSKTKSLVANPSASGDIYTNSNNRSIIAVNKRSSWVLISFDSDKTYYPDNVSVIQIDDFAVGLSYDADFYEEYRSPLENITTLKILVNDTIKGQFNYKWNNEKSDNVQDIVLNKYNYKNLIIRIPSCGISGTSEIEIFPKSIQYNSRKDPPRIKSYIYNHTNNNFVTLGSYNDSDDKLLTAELYEHNWMDYSVKYTVNENTTSQFRIVNLLVTTNTSGIISVSDIKDTDQTCLLCFIQEPKSYTRIYYGKLSGTLVNPEDMNLFSSKIINGNTSINIKIDEKVNKYDKIVVLVPDNVQFKNNFTKSNLIIYWDNLQYSVYTSNVLNSSTDFNLLFS